MLWRLCLKQGVGDEEGEYLMRIQHPESGCFVDCSFNFSKVADNAEKIKQLQT